MTRKDCAYPGRLIYDLYEKNYLGNTNILKLNMFVNTLTLPL